MPSPSLSANDRTKVSYQTRPFQSSAVESADGVQAAPVAWVAPALAPAVADGGADAAPEAVDAGGVPVGVALAQAAASRVIAVSQPAEVLARSTRGVYVPVAASPGSGLPGARPRT